MGRFSRKCCCFPVFIRQPTSIDLKKIIFSLTKRNFELLVHYSRSSGKYQSFVAGLETERQNFQLRGDNTDLERGVCHNRQKYFWMLVKEGMVSPVSLIVYLAEQNSRLHLPHDDRDVRTRNFQKNSRGLPVCQETIIT
ncbi:uncharacterized protein LOC125682268 [Ostrea edulis]|uniref:uncharacterized protein LOC125682268 n=1 Tax=Ostrea edulis TaxID=37623 RepID=UPI0024AECC07|nr:uncharacterized protein LOC125682268 [Ostrea edulis]